MQPIQEFEKEASQDSARESQQEELTNRVLIAPDPKIGVQPASDEMTD